MTPSRQLSLVKQPEPGNLTPEIVQGLMMYHLKQRQPYRFVSAGNGSDTRVGVVMEVWSVVNSPRGTHESLSLTNEPITHHHSLSPLSTVVMS